MRCIILLIALLFSTQALAQVSSLQAYGYGGGPVPDGATGSIVDCQILGPTTISNFVNPNGWVLRCFFKGMASGGTVDASKVSVTVVSAGYDNTGVATTTSRTIPAQFVSGGGVPQQMRQLYPQQNSPLQLAVGSDTALYFVLADYVFQGDPVTVTIGAGAYIKSAVTSSALAATTIPNYSTLQPYKPIGVWMTRPYQIISGGTFHVERHVSSPYGQQSRMLAAEKFILYNSNGATPSGVSATVTSMVATTTATASGLITPVFAADLNVSGLTTGKYCLAAEDYPFIGLAYKTITDAFGPGNFTTTTATMFVNQAKCIPVYIDNSNNYPEIDSYISTTGSNSNGCTNGSSDACADVYTALTKGVLRNGHADSCNVHVKAETGTYTINGTWGGNMGAVVVGPCWAVVEADAGQTVTFSGTSSTATNLFSGKRMLWKNVTLSTTTTANFIIFNNEATTVGPFTFEESFESVNITGPASNTHRIIDRAGLIWDICNSNLTLVGSLGSDNSSRYGSYMVCGSTIATNSSPRFLNYMGVGWTGGSTMDQNQMQKWQVTDGNGTLALVDTSSVVSNTWYNETITAGLPGARTAQVPSNQIGYISGCVWNQNLIEERHQGANASVKGSSIWADSAGGLTTPTPMCHYFYNSVVGDGPNLFYNESQDLYVRKFVMGKFNVYADVNVKADMYAAGTSVENQHRVGNFEWRWHVLWDYNTTYDNSSLGSPLNLVGEVYSAHEQVEALACPHFTNDQSFLCVGAGDTGNGDYHPLSNAIFYNAIPSASEAYPIDILGATRAHHSEGAYN